MPGGGGGAGFLRIIGFRFRRGLTLIMLAGAFFGLAERARTGGVDFLLALTAPRFAGTRRDLALSLRATTLVAFRARALLAGERLVAGFKRVDLPATTRLRDADDVDECREVERGSSLFTLLAVGLLMRKSPRLKDRSAGKPWSKTAGA